MKCAIAAPRGSESNLLGLDPSSGAPCIFAGKFRGEKFSEGEGPL